LGFFSNIKDIGTMKILEYGKLEVGRANLTIEELVDQSFLPSVEEESVIAQANYENSSSIDALRDGMIMHLELVNNLWNIQQIQLGPLEGG
jgi:hypothetical protein